MSIVRHAIASTESDDSYERSDNGKPLPNNQFSRDYQPQKRKAEDFHGRSESRSKRLKSSYSDKYRKLYNESVSQQLAPQDFLVHNDLEPSLIDGSTWTVQEKELLLQALSRKGRHDLRAIATTVRTKSVLEIQAFCQVLRAAAIDHDFFSTRRKGLFDVSTVDSALEISQACEASLDEAAEALSHAQYLEDVKAEQSALPETWLISRKTVKWIDKQLAMGDEGIKKVNQDFPSAELINVGMLQKLSQQFFMNSSDPVNNWRSYRDAKDRNRQFPSIMHSAFNDLHKSVIARTKRLVQSALFLAASRSRSEGKSPSSQVKVRHNEVLEAIHMAGMQSNARAFWATVARKCNLQVFENVERKQVLGEQFSFDEIENYLKNYENWRGRYRSRTRSCSRQSSGERNASVDDISTSESEDSSTRSEGSTPGSHNDMRPSESEASDATTSSNSSSVDDDYETRQECQEKLQDNYMEASDMRASQREEQRLWEILGKVPPNHTLDEVGEKLPTRHEPPHKSREDFTDWKDWLEYASEWEIYPTKPMSES